MSKKTLYRQALEIYQAQQTMNSYSVEHNNAWHRWYNDLTPTKQRHLAQVAVIVAKVVDEVTRGFAEALVSADFIPEVTSEVRRKFLPTSFLEAIGIEKKDYTFTDRGDAGTANNDLFVDTFTDMIPGDDYVGQESRNVLETALDVSMRQQFSKDFSLKRWFEDLTGEDQQVLQDSTETLLDCLPEVVGTYMVFYQVFFQSISQDSLRDLIPIQQLWKQ